jgi:hypothetical protein
MVSAKMHEWKTVILRSIDSCITNDQLSVCWNFIGLFQIKYQGEISETEYMQHSEELQNAYLVKHGRLNPELTFKPFLWKQS